MDKRNLAKQVVTASRLTGSFRLRSGGESDHYIDKYLFEANPVILRNIAHKLANFIPAETEVLAGLEMGGIPLVTALSLESGIPAAFVRKAAKKYGTRRVSEGASVEGKRVCVVEDVVTAGEQVLASVANLREAGADVRHVICAIGYDGSAAERLREHGLALHCLFTMDELKEAGEDR